VWNDTVFFGGGGGRGPVPATVLYFSKEIVIAPFLGGENNKQIFIHRHNYTIPVKIYNIMNDLLSP
jgi:hypothetical protein